MIKVQFDKSGMRRMLADFPKRHAAAMSAALKSESYRLNQQIQKFAKSEGAGSWNKYAPITKPLRKGQGYGKWVARFSRYFVDVANLTAFAGMIDKQPGQTNTSMRFTPISRSFASSARRLSAGFTMVIGREQQRQIAKRLTSASGRNLRGVKTARGMQSKLIKTTAMIPRIGVRRVAARPFAGPVLQQEHSRSVRNIQALYAAKFNGVGYSRNWAKEWGNT
ncbi:MAG: hypothetical protein KKH22_06570 [Proteobacteria bacterium]|nr:hypothetical protein [Pseudomonadota bacterium]